MVKKSNRNHVLRFGCLQIIFSKRHRKNNVEHESELFTSFSQNTGKNTGVILEVNLEL